MSREYKLPFRIAGLNLIITSGIPIENLLLRDNLYLFKEDSEENNYSIKINIQENSRLQEISGNVIYDPGDMWKLYRQNSKVFAVLFDDKSRPKCVIKPSENWENIDMQIKIYGDEDRSIIDSGALELVFRTNLIYKHGVIFHSSLVDDNGKGILFTGNSGDGKSTQSAFWKGLEGTEILNEDRNAVRITDDGIFGYGTPWGGTARRVLNRKVKLNAIVLITKSKNNSIEKLSLEKSIPMLIARTFFPYWDKELAGKTIETIASVASEVPVYMLHCKPEKEVVDIVRSVI